jgi:predicted cobalt transporter CbtA
MGERVVVNPAEAEPQRVVPLEYGRGSPARDALQRSWQQLSPSLHRGIRALGGPRQVVFAVGFASVLGGLADVLGTFSDGAGIFWMVIGGLMIGLSVRFPWLR